MSLSAILLSYASQDADFAKQLGEAMRAAGLDRWSDQTELRSGDAWDASIRKQIEECVLILLIISANTQQRKEGYFRLEALADRITKTPVIRASLGIFALNSPLNSEVETNGVGWATCNWPNELPTISTLEPRGQMKRCPPYETKP